MPLLQTPADSGSLVALQARIAALEDLVAQLERNRPAVVDRNEGIGIVTGILHQYKVEYNWGLEPYTPQTWSYINANWPLQPYMEPRSFTIEQLYHAFTTWGDYRYARI
ncbi:MAG: hypothetical protein GY738_23935 [Pseudoalteromonas sp.]|nr:hypothetical protein [Pseudoalteromonas sp.]